MTGTNVKKGVSTAMHYKYYRKYCAITSTFGIGHKQCTEL